MQPYKSGLVIAYLVCFLFCMLINTCTDKSTVVCMRIMVWPLGKLPIQLGLERCLEP